MGEVVDILHSTAFKEKPPGLIPATAEHISYPATQLEGLGIYLYTPTTGWYRVTINRFTQGLAAFQKRGWLWLDNPPRKYYANDNKNLQTWHSLPPASSSSAPA